MTDLAELRETCERQRREIAHLNDVLHRKNIELDALHMVWCDGGCYSGVHRYEDRPVTEEIVVAAERNTARLRRWFDVVRFKLDRYPSFSDWHREEAERLARKVPDA